VDQRSRCMLVVVEVHQEDSREPFYHTRREAPPPRFPYARHLSSGPPDQLDPVGRRVVALPPPNEPSILTTRFCGDE
jgi:hypothetical protein